MQASRTSVAILVTILFMAGATGAGAEELSRDMIPAEGSEITIHPINHATFVMQWGETTVFVDPVGGADAFTDFDPPELILITHIHVDHTSAETMKGVSTETTRVVAPTTVAGMLGDDIPGHLAILANGESLDHDGIRIDAIPAYNLTEDRLNFHPQGRDNGYIVTIGGKRIYIAGDTEDIPEMRSLQNIDAAFVCMNLPYTMTVESAAGAVLEFAPKIVYPYHYRGKGGMSDLEAFRVLVAKNPAIDVRLMKWY